MSVVEIYGGRVDRRYLMKKSKDELATMYLQALDLLERRTQPEATAPAMTPDYSEMSREALERHAARMAQQLANDKPRQFYDKHATGPMLPPSCLCCGKLPDKIAIRHAELPGIVICEECRTGTAPAQDLSAAILALPLPNTNLTAEVAGYKVPVYGAQHMRDFAMSALASPADALVAGDRVDTVREFLRSLQRYENDCGDMMEHSKGDWVKYWDMHDVIHAPDMVAAIQAQKDGQ